MKKRVFKRLYSLAIAGIMFVCYPLAASAEQYSISSGPVIIRATMENGQTKYTVNNNTVDANEIEITGSNGVNSYYVEITSESGASALIRFKDLYIDNSTVTNGFAVITGGDGKVEIELDGDNTLKAGENRAGLQKGNVELLVIKDADGTAGKLAATGGFDGAGIGGGKNQSVNNIVIEGGAITATGGIYGAGIGGGDGGSGTVTISGGTVVATSESGGAGIGGGNGGSGTVTINKGAVEATGGLGGAGIGGGYGGSGTVTINKGTVEATGGFNGAGIGGGADGAGTVIITGGTTTATSGGQGGAGIGGGSDGVGTVTITGGTTTATGVEQGAGIGGGDGGTGKVTISGGNVTAIGGACGAGIGGGSGSNGSTITISGSSNVYVAGGSIRYFNAYGDGIGPGAAIGEGGNFDDNRQPVLGINVVPDVSGLYTTGSVTTYAVGTSLDAIKQGTASGNTIVGTVPDPNANTNTTTPEEPKVNELKAEEPKKEEPKPEVPKLEEPPIYTERSCIADVNVAALIAAALKADPNAKEINIEFDDNICLTPDIMKDLFADNRVAKNCMFSHEGKRYVLRINAVDTASETYADCFEVLKKEPGGLAGFKRMAQIFEVLNVTLKELDQ